LQHDKLLVILSAASLKNSLIEGAVIAAIEVEQRRKEPILFPIRADETVMQSQVSWAAYIRRTRFIGDFTAWQDQAAYERADSTTGASATEPPGFRNSRPTQPVTPSAVLIKAQSLSLLTARSST